MRAKRRGINDTNRDENEKKSGKMIIQETKTRKDGAETLIKGRDETQYEKRNRVAPSFFFVFCFCMMFQETHLIWGNLISGVVILPKTPGLSQPPVHPIQRPPTELVGQIGVPVSI